MVLSVFVSFVSFVVKLFFYVTTKNAKNAKEKMRIKNYTRNGFISVRVFRVVRS